MTTSNPLLRTLSVALGLAFATSGAHAAVDQENTGFISGGITLNSGVFGQSFVPTLDSIDFAEFQVNDQNPGFGEGDYIAVRVRDGAINGSILGTSNTVFFADQVFNPINQPTELVHFSFSSPLALTPGHIYVLEPFRAAPSTLESDLGFFGTGFNNDPYVNGTAFFHGAVLTGVNAPFDLWFSEGTTVPLPAAVWLFAPALAGLGRLRRRA